MTKVWRQLYLFYYAPPRVITSSCNRWIPVRRIAGNVWFGVTVEQAQISIYFLYPHINDSEYWGLAEGSNYHFYCYPIPFHRSISFRPKFFFVLRYVWPSAIGHISQVSNNMAVHVKFIPELGVVIARWRKLMVIITGCFPSIGFFMPVFSILEITWAGWLI